LRGLQRERVFELHHGRHHHRRGLFGGGDPGWPHLLHGDRCLPDKAIDLID